jgi:mRNA-degrading endonuclease RelE of RelBE toxin-antitoxin system
VAFDPSTGCASGLHAGTYEYAKMYASGALLKVVINPRDVVSVPTDSDAQKLRVSRYRVVETIDAPETLPVVGGYDYEDEYDYDARETW